MARRRRTRIDCNRLELDGARYVIVREALFDQLCERAGAQASPKAPLALELDAPTLSEKLAGRRRAAGLTQAALARRAGIRPETLNRIERGHTTPDFSTVRKLVVAMDTAEREAVESTAE